MLELLGLTDRGGDIIQRRNGGINLSAESWISCDFGHYLSLGRNKRSLVFMEGRSKKLIRDIQGINFRLEAFCCTVPDLITHS